MPSIRILGGGAQSELWCQIVADVLDRRVEQVAQPRDAQLRGVALWARVVLGEISLDDVPALVPVAATFVPDAANRATYDRIYGEYRGLAKTLGPVSRGLAGR